ncbi:MAG TPA: YegP family protein [Acidobacteriota bacterium]|jgi:hypothetical protein
MATFVIYEDTRKEYRWRLVSNNGRIIADSAEGYSTKSGCRTAVDLVKTEAPTAHVVEK